MPITRKNKKTKRGGSRTHTRRHKRSGRKGNRSGHKRSGHKGKRSGSKRSGHKRLMRGGSGHSPWVGSPYLATDLKPSGNFLPLSDTYGVPAGLPVPPINSNPQFGGRRRRSRRHKQRGGGFTDSVSSYISSIVPDDIMNAGRYVPSAISGLMDRYNGLIPSASSQVYPTQQPLAQQNQPTGSVSAPNIGQSYVDAVDYVKTIG